MRKTKKGFQQVSLALAKQLKEAGYKQEGLRWWGAIWDEEGIIGYDLTSKRNEAQIAEKDGCFVAPTVAELGETLEPTCFSYYEMGIWVAVWDLHGRDRLWDTIEVTAETEADARALLWLELKKRGIIR